MATYERATTRPAPRHAARRRHRADRRRAAHGPHLEALLTVLPSLPRPALARLVQKAIDRMDDMDTDPDREDDDPDHCLAGDNGCGAIVIDGRTYWGSDTEAIASL